jgi:hypothetical protein
VKVIENPTKTQEKQADVVVKERRTGQITSRISIPSPQPTPLPGDTPTPKPVLVLNVGDKFSAPAAGEIKTIYLDSAGRQIGEGVHPVTGETLVTVGQESLDISTKFRDPVTVDIDLPEPPKKLWHIGLYGVTNFDRVGIGGHIQKDFPIWDNLVIYGRYERDWDRRPEVGIEFNF